MIDISTKPVIGWLKFIYIEQAQSRKRLLQKKEVWALNELAFYQWLNSLNSTSYYCKYYTKEV